MNQIDPHNSLHVILASGSSIEQKIAEACLFELTALRDSYIANTSLGQMQIRINARIAEYERLRDGAQDGHLH